jgi:hypothetical protein
MTKNVSIVKYVCEDVVAIETGCKNKYMGLPSTIMRRKVKELRKDKQALINVFILSVNASNVKSELPKRLNSMFGGEANLSKWDDIVFIFGMMSTLAEKYKNVFKFDVDLINIITSYLEQPKMCDWIKCNGDWYTFCLQNYTKEDIDLDRIELIKYLGVCMIMQLTIF